MKFKIGDLVEFYELRSNQKKLGRILAIRNNSYVIRKIDNNLCFGVKEEDIELKEDIGKLK